MADITLVRQQSGDASEQEKEAARRMIFGMVDGLGERGRRQWRRLWNQIVRLEPGEMMSITTHKERIGWYHRKHMAMESALFEAQERFEEFEAFRAWLKTGSGFVEWYPGPKGGVIPVPRSISYAKLEQADMEQFHDDAVAFLRTAHAQKTLWPHLAPARASEMLELVLQGFGE
ncbi:hypothetical protein LMG7053_05169 [Achromobacter ruhlandii]|uniref:DUF1367 domain-containing protein n=1 Tax=Achromobacter ruhlandii TaxID=72557 RepID=A0ABM8M2L2_9BURK|nr:DUF1367 family protein [Achromobacter ruhlandii]CAB3956944.1 hypothetical protein LMG7053_05169 [Achromobacter ruhlandii]